VPFSATLAANEMMEARRQGPLSWHS